jgi:hypothetical protein
LNARGALEHRHMARVGEDDLARVGDQALELVASRTGTSRSSSPHTISVGQAISGSRARIG